MTEDLEKRLHPRVDAALVIKSRVLDPSELPILASSLGRPDPPIPQLNVIRNNGKLINLASVNLSLGGLSASGDLELDSKNAWPKGADMVVEFDLKDEQPPVRAVAQVMWSRQADGQHHVGLMFLLIADSAFMRIQDFIAKNITE